MWDLGYKSLEATFATTASSSIFISGPLIAGLTQSKGVSNSALKSRLDALATNKLVRVRDAGKSALRSSVLVGAGTKVNIVQDRVANLFRESGGNGVLDIDENGALNKRLGAHTGVHRALATVEVGVVDVGGSEAEKRHAALDVGPEVVGVGDVEVSDVLVAVAVGVADERGLEVVVEVGVAD